MRLSLCMIVKDEARLLPGCLASVVGVVDEVVIVDTGSTDDTPLIAERSGARLERLAWADDFSAPRNLALECASGDWVLQLDADERLAPGAAAGLRAAMRRRGADLGMVRLHDATREDASVAEVLSGRARRGDALRLPRLFRRRPGLRYQGVVHETVDEWLAERGALAVDVEADIVHLGAIPGLRAARGKSERNLRLLERRCALEPESLTPLALLAAELFEGGRVAEAAQVAERGWALLARRPPWRSIHLLAVVRAQAASLMGDPCKVQETAEAAARLEGSTSDLSYLQGCALELDSLRLDGRPARERLGAAVACYRGAMAPRPGEDARRLVQGSAGWASRVRLGTALLRLGEPAAARAEFGAAAAAAPDPMEARLGEVEARLDAGDAGGALQAVEPLLGPRPDGSDPGRGGGHRGRRHVRGPRPAGRGGPPPGERADRAPPRRARPGPGRRATPGLRRAARGAAGWAGRGPLRPQRHRGPRPPAGRAGAASGRRGGRPARAARLPLRRRRLPRALPLGPGPRMARRAQRDAMSFFSWATASAWSWQMRGWETSMIFAISR